MTKEMSRKDVCQAHAEWFGELMRKLVVPIAATFMEHGWKHGLEEAATGVPFVDEFEGVHTEAHVGKAHDGPIRCPVCGNDVYIDRTE